MRVAIYNRYWATRGGGERYAGAIAEILAQRHRVELLGPEEIDLHSLGGHLGLDLSSCTFRLIPSGPERRVTPITSEYDLLFNCTYLSRLRSRAARSVYLVLFPQTSWPRHLVRGARRLVEPWISDPPEGVVPLEGFHPRDDRGSRWTRNVARLLLRPEMFCRDRARIRLSTPEPLTLEEMLSDVRGAGIAWRVEQDDLVIERRPDAGDGPVEIELRTRTFVPADLGMGADRRRLGVCLVDPKGRGLGGRVRTFAERAAGKLDGHDPAIPASYDLLLSISEFTRHWVERRWGQSSRVLAPPVDTELFTAPEPDAKGRVILSVGRFFHGSHNKKHLEMLRVFRGMVDRGEIPDGWEYHLVGNLHRDRLVDLDYFAELQRLTEGYPAKLLVDLSLERLIDEYRSASIFWHAAGWGESERRRPEKFEHFGLTTCEAMSSGCIPVVIAKAGQLEIVAPGENGFVFETGGELAAVTKRLIDAHGEPWVRELAVRASRSVERFSRSRFEVRLLEILEEHGLLG